MSAKSVVSSLLLVGACSTPTLSSSQQEVADPAPILSLTSASFHFPVGGTNIGFCGQDGVAACTSGPPVQVRWGTPGDGINQSGLGFASAGSHVVVYDESFGIGALTHFNFPTLSGTWASGVSLDLGLRVDPSIVGAPLFDASISIPISIHETSNGGLCEYPSTTPCADKITFGTSTFELASTANFTIYELEIAGFLDLATSTVVDGLISQEGGTSTATLVGVMREHCQDSDENGICDEFDVSRLCPCDGSWANHGQYVSCVAHATTDLVAQGELTQQERSVIVSTAGQSSCGKHSAARD